MKMITIDDIINKLEIIEKESQGKTRNKCRKLKSDIRQVSDKLYYEANFDKRFILPNYNKLLFDIDNLEKQKFYLMVVHIPQIQKEYYNDEAKFTNSMNFINQLKNIAFKEDGIIVKNLYIVTDYLILLIDKQNVERIYKIIKQLKETKGHPTYQLYFHKYEYNCSRTNKNLKAIIKKVNTVFSGKQEIEQE